MQEILEGEAKSVAKFLVIKCVAFLSFIKSETVEICSENSVDSVEYFRRPLDWEQLRLLRFSIFRKMLTSEGRWGINELLGKTVYSCFVPYTCVSSTPHNLFTLSRLSIPRIGFYTALCHVIPLHR